MSTVMRVVGSPFELWPQERWLFVKGYEDTPCGRGHVMLTDKPEEAKRFADAREALTFYRQQSKTVPMRPDGRPNRPLTAYSISVEQLP